MARNGLSSVESLVAAVMRIFSGSAMATLHFARRGGAGVQDLAKAFKTPGVEMIGPSTLAFIYSFVTATLVWLPVDIAKLFQPGIADYMWHIIVNTNSLLGTFLLLGTGLVESLFPLLVTATICLLIYEVASVVAVKIIDRPTTNEEDSLGYYCIRYFGVYMLLILYVFIIILFVIILLADAARPRQASTSLVGIGAAWPLLLVFLFVGTVALVIYEVRRFRTTMQDVAPDNRDRDDPVTDAPGPATAGAVMVSLLLLNYGVLWFKTQIIAANPQSTRWMEKYVAVTDLKCHYSTDRILSITALISNEMPAVERLKPSDTTFIVDLIKIHHKQKDQDSLFCNHGTWPRIAIDTKSRTTTVPGSFVHFDSYGFDNEAENSPQRIKNIENKCSTPLYLSDAIFQGQNKIEQKFLEIEPRSTKEYNFLYYAAFLDSEQKSIEKRSNRVGNRDSIDKFIKSIDANAGERLACIVLNNHKHHVDSFYRLRTPFAFAVAAPLVVNIAVDNEEKPKSSDIITPPPAATGNIVASPPVSAGRLSNWWPW